MTHEQVEWVHEKRRSSESNGDSLSGSDSDKSAYCSQCCEHMKPLMKMVQSTTDDIVWEIQN